MKVRMATGFTLIELLISVLIIGLLVTVSSISFSYAQKIGRDSKRVADLRVIQQALTLYYNAWSYYPGAKTDGGGVFFKSSISDNSDWISKRADETDSLIPKFARALPKDPLNTTNYKYAYVSYGGKPNQYYLATRIEANSSESDRDGGSCAQGSGWYELFSAEAAAFGTQYARANLPGC